KDAQARRLARAVRADDRGELARLDRYRHPGQDRARAVFVGEPLGLQQRAHVRARISNSSTGAPMTAVTMPTGISVGATTTRATASATTRSSPPMSAESGTT